MNSAAPSKSRDCLSQRERGGGQRRELRCLWRCLTRPGARRPTRIERRFLRNESLEGLAAAPAIFGTSVLLARLRRPIFDHPPRALPVEAQEVGERPDQRVGAVGRIAGGAAVEVGGQRAELVFELAERADVKDEPAFVGRRDRLGAQELG
jgi:hypothetical protein